MDKGKLEIDAVMWFRRDLRLEDQHALYRALSDKKSVLPIFIFDQRILEKLPEDDARVTFIYDHLLKIRSILQGNGSDLLILYGKVEGVFDDLISQYGAFDVYTNEDYEPYARTRDGGVKKKIIKNGGQFHAYKDHVLQAPGEVLKDDGTPYTVYTPYSKKALGLLGGAEDFGEFEITDEAQKSFVRVKECFDLLSLGDMGFVRSEIIVPDFSCDGDLIDGYQKSREFPENFSGTSHAGPHLRFGTVSVRELARRSDGAVDNTFLKELLWRDFFQAILYYYPQTPTTSFKVKYDAVPWREGVDADKDFALWRDGKTGYPIVDAGMRELSATGTMHNRVRMVVASFLCKHLLIDWRRGERYFALKLLDYELASNVGNWQWAMGGGCDAAPYFRIFNPYTQQEKFDKDFTYIKKWIPEYGTDDYPDAMVDHKKARERALSVYKESLLEDR